MDRGFLGRLDLAFDPTLKVNEEGERFRFALTSS